MNKEIQPNPHKQIERKLTKLQARMLDKDLAASPAFRRLRSTPYSQIAIKMPEEWHFYLDSDYNYVLVVIDDKNEEYMSDYTRATQTIVGDVVRNY